jgi:hypothetical protein
VFWDEGDKRGWLVNGTSALLHLVRASLEHDRTGKFRSAYIFRPDQLVEATSTYAADSAIEVLMHPQNRKLRIHDERKYFDDKDARTQVPIQHVEKPYYCFQDRAEQVFESLEKMIDHEIDANGQQGVKVKLRARTHLEGWDFKDLAADNDPFYPRVATMQAIGKGWVDFTRSIHAIVLFGKGFGDIIQPLKTSNPCDYWAKLPKGRYYLAADVDDLNDIMDMHGDPHTNPLRLSNDIFWHNPIPGDGQCCCRAHYPSRMPFKNRNEHSDFSQILLPSMRSRVTLKQSSRPSSNPRAVVFGYNMTFPWHWRDYGGPEPGDLPDAAGTSEIPPTQSADSVIGSSPRSLSSRDAERLLDTDLRFQNSSEVSGSSGGDSLFSMTASPPTTMENPTPPSTLELGSICDSSCESTTLEDATAAQGKSGTTILKEASNVVQPRMKNKLRYVAALRSKLFRT